MEPEVCYHVYNRTIQEPLLFKSERNYEYFLNKWDMYFSSYFSTYAFCLIPNHFHFLIKCKTPDSEFMNSVKQENTSKSEKFLNGEIPYSEFIESQFKRFFTSYSGAFNKENERSGSLFKAKFKRIPIRHPAHFSYMICYIHHNPIHHKLATDFTAWKYNSYVQYLSDSPQINTKPVLDFFSDLKDKTGRINFVETHDEFKKEFFDRKNLEWGYSNLEQL